MMSCTRKSTSRKSAGGRNPRQLIDDMYQDRLLMLRLKRIEIPSLPGSIGIQRGDILGHATHRTLLHPPDKDVIDCEITYENAGDQIPNHLLRVHNVSHTLIHLSFVNIRVDHSRVCIKMKRGDTLDLGDDNKFLVILLDPADEYDE
jgi:hypothetical protein